MNERAQDIQRMVKVVGGGLGGVWATCKGCQEQGRSRDPGFPNSSTPGSSPGRGRRGHIWESDGKERPCAALLTNLSKGVVLGLRQFSSHQSHTNCNWMDLVAVTNSPTVRFPICKIGISIISLIENELIHMKHYRNGTHIIFSSECPPMEYITFRIVFQIIHQLSIDFWNILKRKTSTILQVEITNGNNDKWEMS